VGSWSDGRVARWCAIPSSIAWVISASHSGAVGPAAVATLASVRCGCGCGCGCVGVLALLEHATTKTQANHLTAP